MNTPFLTAKCFTSRGLSKVVAKCNVFNPARSYVQTQHVKDRAAEPSPNMRNCKAYAGMGEFTSVANNKLAFTRTFEHQ